MTMNPMLPATRNLPYCRPGSRRVRLTVESRSGAGIGQAGKKDRARDAGELEDAEEHPDSGGGKPARFQVELEVRCQDSE
jgi:hypothetical protein